MEHEPQIMSEVKIVDVAALRERAATFLKGVWNAVINVKG